VSEITSFLAGSAHSQFVAAVRRQRQQLLAQHPPTGWLTAC
jgi:hypothetical protein